MKKLVLILFLLLPVVSYAQPSIVFESETYDFGQVQQGVELEHVFEFENAGTEDLLIEKLAPS